MSGVQRTTLPTIDRAVRHAIHEAFETNVQSFDDMNHLAEHADELARRMFAAASDAIGAMLPRERYAGEEVATTATNGMRFVPHDPHEQRERICRYLPEVAHLTIAPLERSQCEGADGVFLIPHWRHLGDTHEAALERVLVALRESRRGACYSWRDGRLGPATILREPRTAAAWRKLLNISGEGRFLNLHASLGTLHRGKSPRRTAETLRTDEFPLPAYAVGIILLTHETLMTCEDDLAIAALGDRMDDANGHKRSIPLFSMSYETLTFGSVPEQLAHETFGVATGFM